MYQNPSSEELKDLLRNAKTIAVVGLSNDPARASHEVSSYMQSQGYEIVPINPSIEMALGRKAHATLQEVDGKIDIVNIFRRSEHVPEVVDQVLKMTPKPKAVWIQLGIVNDEACQRISDAGIMAIQDACIKVEHYRLLGKEHL